MDKSLAGKKALITGGGSGIGLGIARQFIGAGARVIIAGRTESRLIGACESLGDQASWIQWDVSKPEESPDIIRAASDRMNGLDILVNSAGVLTEHDWQDAFFDITVEDWDRLMNTNLKGVFFACQAFARFMIHQERKGHIVNIASEMAFVPNVNAYGISKWGVRGLTEGLGVLLGPKGICVNGIAPGPVCTSMIRWKEGDVNIHPDHPNGRWAEPDEIGKLAVFLAGSQGENIVGQCILTDGGHSLAGQKKLI